MRRSITGCLALVCLLGLVGGTAYAGPDDPPGTNGGPPEALSDPLPLTALPDLPLINTLSVPYCPAPKEVEVHRYDPLALDFGGYFKITLKYCYRTDVNGRHMSSASGSATGGVLGAAMLYEYYNGYDPDDLVMTDACAQWGAEGDFRDKVTDSPTWQPHPTIYACV